ncbi:MAG: TRAP transporter substrate-binding protein [Alphaproteobacteria bacterium]|nr:TRAP transporter substrate-binding protein [Alphaproteobacteria bacterium]
MTVTRRRVLSVMGASALAAPFVRPAGAQATVTLRLHHFLPPVATAHRLLFQPWAQKVADATGGRLRIQIFPSMQLGGTPPQLYDQARDGVADIIWTLPGYTPGRFPISETLELPVVASRRAGPNSRAAWEFAEKHMRAEMREVKVLAFWAHDHGVIHTKRPVQKLEDLRGMKLRFPTRLAGEAMRAVGIAAIGMPVPQVPEALAQGALDGAVIPWEVVPAVRVHELVRHHTEIPGAPTFYSSTFVLAMNPARYNALPADLRSAFDATIGAPLSAEAGRVWDAAGAEIRQMVLGRGNTITTLPEADKAAWQAAVAPVHAGWLAAMRGRNLDGEALLADVRAMIARYEAA